MLVDFFKTLQQRLKILLMWLDSANDIIKRKEMWDIFRLFTKFCLYNGIIMANMEEVVHVYDSSRSEWQVINYFHLYIVEFFYWFINFISQKMNNLFRKLLLRISSLRNLFQSFNHEVLFQLAQFYFEDFLIMNKELLKNQLYNYIYNVRNDEKWYEIENIKTLVVKVNLIDILLIFLFIFYLS